MEEIEPCVNDTPINRVKRFLDILRYTQADATKHKKQMDELKMGIKILLDNYKSQQHNTTVHTQQMLVDISDNYKKFKEVEEKYITAQRKVDNVKRIIESVNIKPYIHHALQEFNFEL
jgi:hypothetical protein